MIRLIRNPVEIKISLDERRILVRLGGKRFSETMNSKLRTVVREETERALRLIKPRCAAVILDAEELPVENVFRKAKGAALCLCTIGPELENTCTELMAEGEVFRAFVLDGAGSEAVSLAAGQAASWLVQEGLSQGLRAGKPHSPGTKGWDIDGQQFIFRLLPAAKIGVSLSESFMMSPRKSRSFRINYYDGR